MLHLIGQLFGKIIPGNAGKLVVGYFQKKQELAQDYKLAKLNGKIARRKAQDALAVEQMQTRAQLENAQLTSQGNSYRQDWVLFLLSVPVVMAFIPTLAPYAQAGFDALTKSPLWYQRTFVYVLLAIYGYRGVRAALDKFMPGDNVAPLLYAIKNEHGQFRALSGAWVDDIKQAQLFTPDKFAEARKLAAQFGALLCGTHPNNPDLIKGGSG